MYQDIRLDYRREVDQLAVTFAEAPQIAKLVRSIVINGDGAHGPNIYRLLSQAYQTRHILFFDFELGSILEEHTLCATVPLHNLTSLSFSVLPAGFVDKALSICAENIKSLRLYRVNLAAVDMQPWREEKPRWNLPSLRALSLKHVGNMPSLVFKELIANTSATLHSLKIYYDMATNVCRDPQIWKDCNFALLEWLELGSFDATVVSQILQNNGDQLRMLRTIRLSALQAINAGRRVEVSPEESEKLSRTVLDDIPTSVQILEFTGCEDTAVCRKLPDHLENWTTWLPKLRKCPSLTVGANKISDHELAVLRIAYFAAARKSGLRLPEGSQYYALHGSSIAWRVVPM